MMKQSKPILHSHSSNIGHQPSSTTCSVSFIDVVHTSESKNRRVEIMDRVNQYHDDDGDDDDDFDTRIRRRQTDDGVDNPFRPGGQLSQEADIIVQLIKEGKQLTLQSIQSMPELSSRNGHSLQMIPNQRKKFNSESNEDVTDCQMVNNNLSTTGSTAAVNGSSKLKSKSLQRNGNSNFQIMSPVIEEKMMMSMTKSSSCNDGNLNGHSNGGQSINSSTLISPGDGKMSKKERKKLKQKKESEMKEMTKNLNGNNNRNVNQQQPLTKTSSTSSSSSSNSSNSTGKQVNSIQSSGVTSPTSQKDGTKDKESGQQQQRQHPKEGDTSEVKKVIVTSPSVELVKLKKERHCCVIS